MKDKWQSRYVNNGSLRKEEEKKRAEVSTH